MWHKFWYRRSKHDTWRHPFFFSCFLVDSRKTRYKEWTEQHWEDHGSDAKALLYLYTKQSEQRHRPCSKKMHGKHAFRSALLVPWCYDIVIAPENFSLNWVVLSQSYHCSQNAVLDSWLFCPHNKIVVILNIEYRIINVARALMKVCKCAAMGFNNVAAL